MKRSMFKMATAIIASAAMLTSVAACGRTSATSDSADDVTTIDSGKATGDLTIWAMGNEGDLLGDFVKDFEKENPDVTVKVTATRGLPHTTRFRPPSRRVTARTLLRWVTRGWPISPIPSPQSPATST